MANNLTPIEAIRQLVEENLVHLRYSDYQITNRLRKANAYQNNIRWNVNVSTDSTGSGRLSAADANPATSDEVKNANLPLVDYAFTETVQMLRTDIQQAQTAGIGALRNLVDEAFRNHIIKIMRQLNQAVYTGQGGVVDGGIVGMESIINDDVYALIDRGTYPAWDAGFNLENAGAGRALSGDLLKEAEMSTYKTGTGNFDLIMTTPDVVNSYKSLFEDQRALFQPSAPGRADLGFTAVSYAGRPVVFDRDCPAGKMYFLDTSELALYSRDYSTNENFKAMNVNGMTFTMEYLPENNMYSVRFEVGVQAQLKAHDRRAVGVISDIQA